MTVYKGCMQVLFSLLAKRLAEKFLVNGLNFGIIMAAALGRAGIFLVDGFDTLQLGADTLNY